MSGWKVRLIEDPGMFMSDSIRLVVYENIGFDAGAQRILMADGSFKVFPNDGTQLDPGTYGIVLPKAAIEALAVGVQDWQGHTSHADTEARLLREFLAVESARVDKALGR